MATRVIPYSGRKPGPNKLSTFSPIVCSKVNEGRRMPLMGAGTWNNKMTPGSHSLVLVWTPAPLTYRPPARAFTGVTQPTIKPQSIYYYECWLLTFQPDHVAIEQIHIKVVSMCRDLVRFARDARQSDPPIETLLNSSIAWNRKRLE